MKNILIAVPTNKNVETETMKSIYDLVIPEGYNTELQFFYGYQVDQVRNLIADWGKKYDYVLHVDSDIILPSDSLIKMLQADKPVISGLYIQRKPEKQVLEVYQDKHGGGFENIPYWAIENRGVIPIAGCGFGCVLVNSDVYRNIDYPHFLYHSAIDHKHTMSEDLYFCNKARQNGYTLYADTSILCPHVGSTHFTIDTSTEKHLQNLSDNEQLPEDHQDYLFTLKQQGIKPSVIYDIGACVGHWTKGAKHVWRDSSYYLIDATSSVEPIIKKLGTDYSISVLSDIDDKELTFWDNSVSPAGNSYYKENTSFYTDANQSTRRTITLDTLVKEKGWPPPDLVKLDVQGAEMDILKGASNTIKSTKHVILEAQHTEYNIGAPKVEDVLDFMQGLGFTLISNFAGGPNSIHSDGDYHFQRV